MKAVKTILLVLALIASGLFAISRGGAGATVSGMRQVVKEAAGTFIYTDGQSYLLAWPTKTRYAWTIVDATGRADLQSLKLGADTMANLIRDLEQNGFRRVGVDALPASLVTALTSYSWLAAIQSLPNVIVIPLAILTPVPVVVEMGE